MRMFFQRAAAWPAEFPNTRRRPLAIGSTSGHGKMYSRRALQHGDVGDLGGDGRQDRDSGRAATDDDHLLAPDVEILWPELWVDERSGELVATRKVRNVCAVVAENPRRCREPAGLDCEHIVGCGVPYLNGPGETLGAPICGLDSMMRPDVVVDIVLKDDASRT